MQASLQQLLLSMHIWITDPRIIEKYLYTFSSEPDINSLLLILHRTGAFVIDDACIVMLMAQGYLCLVRLK